MYFNTRRTRHRALFERSQGRAGLFVVAPNKLLRSQLQRQDGIIPTPESATHILCCVAGPIFVNLLLGPVDSACVRVCVYMTKHISMYVHKKNLDVDRHLCVGGTNLAKGRDPRCVGEDVVGVLPEVGEHEVDVRMTQGATV